MNEPIEGASVSTGHTGFRTSSEEEGSSTEQVRALGHKAQAKVMSKAEELRGGTARRLHSFADALEDLAEGDGHQDMAPVARAAAGFVRKSGDLLDRTSADDLLDRARSTVRERPGLALLGMIGVGFIGARLLKD
jgi:hypothetical protein